MVNFSFVAGSFSWGYLVPGSTLFSIIAGSLNWGYLPVFGPPALGHVWITQAVDETGKKRLRTKLVSPRTCQMSLSRKNSQRQGQHAYVTVKYLRSRRMHSRRANGPGREHV